ncbi:MAG: sulfate reduction electron transfer complex DsrMKJOP subunit DsrM [Peptococcaceae bacterium]
MKNAGIALAIVLAILAVAYVGVEVLNLDFFFGGILPYIAIAAFIVGFIYRIYNWAQSPVPFRIPTTAGQQKSLDFIKQNKIDNPSSKGGVFVRMALEVLVFRSLFRNSKAEVTDKGDIVYQWEKWLWLFALCFHWGFFLTVFRHLRFFTDPVPAMVTFWEKIDGVFWVDLQQIYLTGFILLLGITGLFIRRIYLDKVRYISLVNDFFPLFLILGIAITGLTMRYLTHADITAIKEVAMGLASFNFGQIMAAVTNTDISVMFWFHLTLVCTLLIYFPTSKLMHAGGIFMSPTRNMANNNRMVRHINPWNPEVEVHTYQEYEHEFHQKMKAVGLPLDWDYDEEGNQIPKKN